MEPRYQRQLVDYTSPAWRLLAVALVFGGLFFFGWFARLFQLEEQFSTFFVITLFSAVLFWGKKRPDRLKRRLGAWGKIALAAQESADDIRASIYSRSIYYGILFGMGYAVLVIISKEVVLAVVVSIYSWQIVAAVGCLTAAAVVAPQFLSAVARKMSIPDEDYPGEAGRREVESREVHETLTGTETREATGSKKTTEKSQETAPGIGYYDSEGNPVSAEEFEKLFSGSADRDDE